MSFPSRLSNHAWVIVLICACGFLVWIDAARAQRVEFVSGLAGTVPVADASSPTGYAAGVRQLIVPEHNNESYQWIAQTQQLLARTEWHVRHVDYDNAPFGRDVRSPSPYRWWRGLIAGVEHLISGRSLGLAVERAALFADPCLHLLVLVGGAFFVARNFGGFPAALFSVGMVAMFPLAGAFLPGQPTAQGLGLAAAIGSVLPLLAGIRPRPDAASRSGDASGTSRRTRRMFMLAGIAGGIGLWVDASRQIPVLAGIALGGFAVSWFARRAATTNPAAPWAGVPWRDWALGGAGTVLAAYLLEYFPAHLGGLRLDVVHPLHGIGWLGAGELLARTTPGLRWERAPGRRRDVVIMALAVLAVTVGPALMLLTGQREFGVDDALAARLTSLPESAVAPNTWAWLRRDGFTLMAWATCLPVLLLLPAGWRLAHRATDAAQRAAIALALGPGLIALVLACFQLRWWNLVDGALLLLVVGAGLGHGPGSSRWRWAAGVALGLAPGAMLVATQAQAGTQSAVTEGEVEALVERDLAHWLANQAGAGGAVILAPPSLTTSLFFHGGLAGLGTPYWENKDGFAAAVRLAGATSPDEAQALARGRGLDYIVIPSWDPFLDEYARLGAAQADHSLIGLLHHWLPPRWLQPVPYRLPRIAGFEGHSVVIFKVVDVQDNATSLSHLAEYFVEMDQLEQAIAVTQALEHFYPSDLGALVARANVEQARGNAAGFADAVKELQPYLARGDDRTLPWDRRVSLAIALAEGKQFEPAREQVRRCLTEMDEPRVRSLTTVSLYRFQVIGRAFGLPIPDQRLRELARELLPAELSAGL